MVRVPRFHKPFSSTRPRRLSTRIRVISVAYAELRRARNGDSIVVEYRRRRLVIVIRFDGRRYGRVRPRQGGLLHRAVADGRRFGQRLTGVRRGRYGREKVHGDERRAAGQRYTVRGPASRISRRQPYRREKHPSPRQQHVQVETL